MGIKITTQQQLEIEKVIRDYLVEEVLSTSEAYKKIWDILITDVPAHQMSNVDVKEMIEKFRQFEESIRPHFLHFIQEIDEVIEKTEVKKEQQKQQLEVVNAP